MKTPSTLDIGILRALRKRNGNISYLQDTLSRAASRASIGSTKRCSVSELNHMSRRDVWNCAEALVCKGWASSEKANDDYVAGVRARDNTTYIITEEGLKVLMGWECFLQFSA